MRLLRELVPNLIDKVLLYFSFNPDSPEEDFKKRNIAQLVLKLKDEFSIGDDSNRIKELVNICDSLCDIMPLKNISRDPMGYDSCYYWGGKFSNGAYYRKMSFSDREKYFDTWENAVFGFKFVYEKYKKFVLPLVYTNFDGIESIGTCFIVGRSFIVTARHCLEGSKSISIGKIPFANYSGAQVLYHSNVNIDIAVIVVKELPEYGFVCECECNVLDKVITMGYPRIPGYTCFQTVEEATISAIPEKRFAVTEGQVAAEAQQLWSRENLFLITAKIKGGNSGGPVINEFGECIGVVSSIPFSEGGDYDDLGYGTAIPIKFAAEIVDGGECEEVDNINFVQYRD